VFRAVTRPIIRGPHEGADTVVWLACAPEALQSTGLFWHDHRRLYLCIAEPAAHERLLELNRTNTRIPSPNQATKEVGNLNQA
jgi:dehydrogenase/reductase SDR family member 12